MSLIPGGKSIRSCCMCICLKATYIRAISLPILGILTFICCNTRLCYFHKKIHICGVLRNFHVVFLGNNPIGQLACTIYIA